MGRWLPTARRKGLGSRRPRKCPNCWLAVEKSLEFTFLEGCQRAAAPFLRLSTLRCRQIRVVRTRTDIA